MTAKDIWMSDVCLEHLAGTAEDPALAYHFSNIFLISVSSTNLILTSQVNRILVSR
jgi:hypothetical protein